MKTIKGPAIFLAQFAGDAAPFNNLADIAGWAAGHGYKGVQIPSWDRRLFDLARGRRKHGLLRRDKGHAVAKQASQLTELSTHLQGQLVAVHPAYDAPSTASRRLRSAATRPRARDWAVEQVLLAAKASRNLGLTAHATFSGALAWPYRLPLAAAPRRPGRRPPSTNWRAAGRRSSMPSTRRASTSATRSTRARTCTTASPSRCSWNV